MVACKVFMTQKGRNVGTVCHCTGFMQIALMGGKNL